MTDWRNGTRSYASGSQGEFVMKAFHPATLQPINPLRFCRPFAQPPGNRRTMIAEAAYYLAQRRGFSPGHELEDWLAAEAEVDLKIAEAAAAECAPY